MRRRSPTAARGLVTSLVTGVAAFALVSCSSGNDADISDPVEDATLGDADGESDERDEQNDSESAEASDADVVAGDGFVGRGALTVTLDDGTVFAFEGDCEIVAFDSDRTYAFAYEGTDGSLANATHRAGEDFVMPSSLQFTDDALWIYRGSEFTDTSADGANWASGVTIEALIDNEPFNATGRLESTCS